MDKVDIVGQIIGGNVGHILIREKGGKRLELGDLLVSREKDSSLILQVFDLMYGSQIPASTKEMMSGINLEKKPFNLEIFEPELRNYTLAEVRALARVNTTNEKLKVTLPKILPPVFNTVDLITSEDLEFLSKTESSFYVGNVRSGTKEIDVGVWLPSKDVFSHHVLIPATTGRGKSNLVKTILWHILDDSSVSALVLDAHNEYYGIQNAGLKDHNNAQDNLVYYTPNNPKDGANLLTVNLRILTPEHFKGIFKLSDAQNQAIKAYFREFKEEWISAIIKEKHLSTNQFQEGTLTVVQRTIQLALGLGLDENGDIMCHNRVFDSGSRGTRIAEDIVRDIEAGKVVILDTSQLGSDAELIIGTVITRKIFDKYQSYKNRGQLKDKPVATIVIEEAPRVIGEDVLKSQENNIYSTIAKEGRKFKIGLTAITQLTSIIPRTILANMNTKIILGNEMVLERQAIISSASQDLSDDDRNIASLDKGEAIVSSIFVPFAMPIKIPLFEDLVKNQESKKNIRKKVY